MLLNCKTLHNQKINLISVNMETSIKITDHGKNYEKYNKKVTELYKGLLLKKKTVILFLLVSFSFYFVSNYSIYLSNIPSLLLYNLGSNKLMRFIALVLSCPVLLAN